MMLEMERKAQTAGGADIQWAHLALLPLVFGLIIGKVSAMLETTSLLLVLVLAIMLGLAARGTTIIPVSVAVIGLVLFPKSMPALQVSSFTFGWGLGDLLILLAFALSLAGIMIGKHARVFSGGLSRLDRAVMFYCLSLVPAMIIGAFQNAGGLAFAVGSYVKSIEGVLVYVVVRSTLRSQRSFNGMMGTFLGMVLGVVSIAWLQRLSPTAYTHALLAVGANSTGYSENFLQSVGWRLAGPFLNANSLGTFLVVAIAFLTVLAAGHQSKPIVGRLVRLLLIASLLVLVLTLSRESYAALLVALGYWLVRSLKVRRLKRIAFAVLFLVLAGAWYFAPLLYGRVISYTFSGGPISLGTLGISSSVGARLDQWGAGLHAVGSYGFLGAGFGQVAQAVGRYLPAGSLSFGGIHQTFLRGLLEGGVIEFFGLLYLIFAIWTSAVKVPTGYQIAVRASLLGLAVTGIVGDTFQNVEVMVPFFYLLAGLEGFMGINRGARNKSTGADHHQELAIGVIP